MYLPRYDANTVGLDAMRWSAANTFIKRLKSYSKQITPQQYRTLRGQALAGDVDGAEKRLQNLVMEHE